MEKRYEALRDAIRRHGDAKGAALPLVLAENASRAPTDADGEKLLGNDKPWRPQAFRQARRLGPYLLVALLYEVGIFASPCHWWRSRMRRAY